MEKGYIWGLNPYKMSRLLLYFLLFFVAVTAKAQVDVKVEAADIAISSLTFGDFDTEKGILHDVVIRYRVGGDEKEGYVLPDFTVGLTLVTMGMSVSGGKPLHVVEQKAIPHNSEQEVTIEELDASQFSGTRGTEYFLRVVLNNDRSFEEPERNNQSINRIPIVF
jgi:hypothetical protein